MNEEFNRVGTTIVGSLGSTIEKGVNESKQKMFTW